MAYKSSNTFRLLFVDYDIEFRTATGASLRNNNFELISVGTVDEAKTALQDNSIDLILTDWKLPDGSGLDILTEARKEHPEIAAIIMTSFGSINGAIDNLKCGSCQYLAKPFKTEELLFQIEKALENKRIREELNNLRQEIAWKYGFDSLVGISRAMDRVKSLAARVAATDLSVLVTGESGTGKELLAKIIHYHSDRRKGKFTPIDCTSIPDQQLESELFGYVEGAFDKAYSDHSGLFEQADRGTVYLSNIGTLPVTVQAKILRLLECGEICPVGSETPRRIDIRLIAATSGDIKNQVKQGNFREDLYYRLNVLPLYIPPLRERADDVAALVEHIIREENKKAETGKISITGEALQKLIAHKWPGNVRELNNTIRRAIALCSDGRINADDIMFISTEPTSRKTVKRIEINDSDDWTLEESLRQRIESTLYATNWNYTKTAAKLGIGRTTLWRKIRKYNIVRGEETSATLVK